MNVRQAGQLFRVAISNRTSVLVMAGFAVIVLLNALRVGFPGAPQGTWQVVLGDVDGNLTYGLLCAMLLAVASAGSLSAADAVLHAGGVGPGARILLAVCCGSLAGLAARVITVGVEIVGGFVNDVTGASGTPDPFVGLASVALGQTRLLVVYVLCGVFGAAVCAALGRPLPALLIVAAATCVYLPFAGAAANRVRALLDALPYLPLGALRGALSGNGAIFGVDPQHTRLIAPLTGAWIFSAYLVMALCMAALRLSKPEIRGDWRGGTAPLYVAGGLTAACVAGAVLPVALRNQVPWQWRPQWRAAQDSGWSSDAVAVRWASDHGGGAGVNRLFASAADARAAEQIDLSGLAGASAVQAIVPPEVRDGRKVRLLVTFDPGRRTGNLVIHELEYQLDFVIQGDRYLISGVSEPLITQAGTAPGAVS